jgi:hypothetical protein
LGLSRSDKAERGEARIMTDFWRGRYGFWMWACGAFTFTGLILTAMKIFSAAV